MIGKGAAPAFFAIANYNYTLTFFPTESSISNDMPTIPLTNKTFVTI